MILGILAGNPLVRRFAMIVGALVLVGGAIWWIRHDAARDERARAEAARDAATVEAVARRNEIEKETRDASDLDLCIALGRPDCGL